VYLFFAGENNDSDIDENEADSSQVSGASRGCHVGYFAPEGREPRVGRTTVYR